MEHSTRRSILKGLSALPAIIAFPVAAKAQELPVDKVNRLGWELAKALNEYANGSMHAVIHPTDKRGAFSVGFSVSDFELSPEKQIEAAMLTAKAAMERQQPNRHYRTCIKLDSGIACVIATGAA